MYFFISSFISNTFIATGITKGRGAKGEQQLDKAIVRSVLNLNSTEYR